MEIDVSEHLPLLTLVAAFHMCADGFAIKIGAHCPAPRKN